MSCIQLPYGIACDNNQKKIKCNLLSNYKAEVLCYKLPYLAPLNNPIFKEKIKNILKNNKGVQKATGNLQNGLHESLNYIVLDNGKLNESTSVHHLLHTKLAKNVMQKPNALDFVFRDIAKLDVQNPVVKDLMKNIQCDKLTKTPSAAHAYVSKYLVKLKNAKIKTRFGNLKKFNERFDNEKADEAFNKKPKGVDKIPIPNFEKMIKELDKSGENENFRNK